MVFTYLVAILSISAFKVGKCQKLPENNCCTTGPLSLKRFLNSSTSGTPNISAICFAYCFCSAFIINLGTFFINRTLQGRHSKNPSPYSALGNSPNRNRKKSAELNSSIGTIADKPPVV